MPKRRWIAGYCSRIDRHSRRKKLHLVRVTITRRSRKCRRRARPFHNRQEEIDEHYDAHQPSADRIHPGIRITSRRAGDHRGQDLHQREWRRANTVSLRRQFVQHSHLRPDGNGRDDGDHSQRRPLRLECRLQGDAEYRRRLRLFDVQRNRRGRRRGVGPEPDLLQPSVRRHHPSRTSRPSTTMGSGGSTATPAACRGRSRRFPTFPRRSWRSRKRRLP